MRNVQMRIVEYSNTYNELEPARLQLENLFHSFSWNILGTAQSFHQAKHPRRSNDETMVIQLEQTNFLLHRDTVPIGNYPTVINYGSSRQFFLQ